MTIIIKKNEKESDNSDKENSAVMLQQLQMKQEPKLSFFITDQRISATKAQTLPNQRGGGVEPPKPPFAYALEQWTHRQVAWALRRIFCRGGANFWSVKLAF